MLFGDEVCSKPFGPRPGGGSLPFVGDESLASEDELVRGGGSCGRGGGRLFDFGLPIVVFVLERGGGLPDGRRMVDVLPSFVSSVLLLPRIVRLDLGTGKLGFG